MGKSAPDLAELLADALGDRVIDADIGIGPAEQERQLACVTASGVCLEHIGRLIAVFVDPGGAFHAARDVVRGFPVELGGEVV